MKKLLLIIMVCLMGIGAFASDLAFNYFKKCVVHYTVIDEEGNTVWSQDVTADSCEQAVKIARWAYWFHTGDLPNYQS